ncbi:MAG: DMT family transporter [Candidatus Nanopelagicales bacterium]
MAPASLSRRPLVRPAAHAAGAGGWAVAAVVLGGILFGTAGTARALDPSGTTSMGVGSARLVVGGLTMLLVVMVQGRSPVAALRLWRTPAGVLTGACAALYQVGFFASVQLTGVALGTLVTVGSSPVLAGLLAWAVLGQRPSRAWAGATALCLVGLVLLSADGLEVGRPAGVALALMAGLAAATYNICAKKLLDDGVPILDLLTAAFLLGGILLAPWLFITSLTWLTTGGGILLALYLGVGTMAVANLLFTHGLKRLSPGPATTLTLTDPLTATTLGVVVLGETLNGRAWLGLGLVLLGLVLQGLSSARRRTATLPRDGVLL